MDALTVEYQGEDGLQIVRIDNGKYYFGNGEDVNAVGISANQFLRFHPYMTFVGDQQIKPSEQVTEWITNH